MSGLSSAAYSAPRAHMVFAWIAIQIASAVCLTALREVLVFPTPVSLTFCPYVVFRPGYRTNRASSATSRFKSVSAEARCSNSKQTLASSRQWIPQHWRQAHR